MHGPASPLRGIVLMLLAVMCFAALDATSKQLSRTYPVAILVWVRYVVHCLLMVVFLAPSMRFRLIATRRPVAMTVRALLLVATTGLCMAAFRVMPLAETTAIIFVSPLAVGLLAGPLLGERVGKARWLATLAGFAGMLMVARPGAGLSPEGIGLALGAAAAYTVYQIQTRQMSPTEDTWTMLFYTALVGTVVMSLGLPVFWGGPAPDLVDALMICSLGLYGGGGHYLLISAFRHAPASTLSPFLYAQLVWAGLLGGLFFDHWPDGMAIAGMAVIAASSIAMAAWERRSRGAGRDTA
ncbi:MAG: DMT family transporter [Rhodocyclaceae bacterium]|nr:DMT family transporter [Rhodocyclaceae bacterium]